MRILANFEFRFFTPQGQGKPKSRNIKIFKSINFNYWYGVWGLITMKEKQKI